MLGRRRFKYLVALADQRTNEQIDYELQTFWSDGKDFITHDSIGVAAAAQAFQEAKGTRKFFPVGVTKVG